MPILYTGVHGEALDGADLPILPDRSHFMWIHVLHVRLARPRESHPIGPRTPEVRDEVRHTCWRLSIWQPSSRGKPRIL